MTNEKKYENALKDISMYILPVYEKDGEKWVKHEHAYELKIIANKALSQNKQK